MNKFTRSITNCLDPGNSRRSIEDEKILARVRELDELISQYNYQCELAKNKYLTIKRVKEDFEREKEELVLVFHQRW